MRERLAVTAAVVVLVSACGADVAGEKARVAAELAMLTLLTQR